MTLRLFLPATDRLDPATPLAWALRDARGRVLREAMTPLADAPRGEPVEMVLPAERVLFARLALPRVNAATIRELLPYAVEDRLLADPGHIHAVPGRKDARGETLVAVVDRGWLEAMRTAIIDAGLPAPRHAWCESALLAGGAGDWHLVLDAARGMLVDDDGVAATFDRGEHPPLALRVALDEATPREARPTVVRVHPARGAALPDLAAWSAELGLPFQAGDPWETIARGNPDAGYIELLQGEFAPASRRAFRVPRAAVVLAATIAALQLLFTGIDAFRLQREARALEARRESIFRQAFPEARVVVDPDLQMARNLAELQRARGIAAGDEFLGALTTVARESGGPVKGIDYAQGKAVAR